MSNQRRKNNHVGKSMNALVGKDYIYKYRKLIQHYINSSTTMHKILYDILTSHVFPKELVSLVIAYHPLISAIERWQEANYQLVIDPFCMCITQWEPHSDDDDDGKPSQSIHSQPIHSQPMMMMMVPTKVLVDTDSVRICFNKKNEITTFVISESSVKIGRHKCTLFRAIPIENSTITGEEIRQTSWGTAQKVKWCQDKLISINGTLEIPDSDDDN
jgi:hypothetical protein